MPGQWCAPLFGAPFGGRAGAVGLAELVVLGVVVVVELAALAIAAPPPTSAPVTTTAVSTLRIGIHLLSFV
jgi:hypothetical protein